MDWDSWIILRLAMIGVLLLSLEVSAQDHLHTKRQIFNNAFGLNNPMMSERRMQVDSAPGEQSKYGSNAPDAYRWAPDSSQSPIKYVITAEELNRTRSQFMYWFFDLGGNNGHGDFQTDIHSSTPQIHKNLNIQLPFFGFRFNYTRLSINGYLEFSDPPKHLKYKLEFPIANWPKSNDPSFIGIFYSKCRVGNVRPEDADQRRPGVYFRLERDLQTRTDMFGVQLRERLTWDIRDGMIGSESFQPKHAILVTWKNVSFAGGIQSALDITNTFQLVLATDEVYTYAIFNYLDLKWTAHTEANGDTTTGEGGTPAFVGFNAGNGTHAYEYQPYSQRMTIRDLTGRGWVNGFPGRHIFRIDEKILLGNCNKDLAGANLPLVFAPESGNMLGGTVVNITGPCFERDDKITCWFDITPVDGTVVDKNRAICIQPELKAQGYVKFQVSRNGETFDYKGQYFVEPPATAAEKIFIYSNSAKEGIHGLGNDGKIKIKWNRYNLTSDMSASINISLWGYRELSITPEHFYIDTLYEGALTEYASTEYGQDNLAMYEIDPQLYVKRNQNGKNIKEWLKRLKDVYFGFIRISLVNPAQYAGSVISPTIWSRPIPLGWYMAPHWQEVYGNSWAKRLCDRWITNDRKKKNFASQAAICPCHIKHALTDRGRFMPDIECDKDSNPTCLYHKKARHCVRTGTPNYEGAEQQCCYGDDGYLMLSYDDEWGSKPRRSHALGSFPYVESNKVPSLSQWFNDVMPNYLCCLWQNRDAIGCETLRYELRPTQDCVAYQSPGVATIFGDPHFVTFDQVEYTFNGKGEFVLVKVDTNKEKLDIQARFEQVNDNYYGEVRATQLTSIVAKVNTSSTIEVKIRPPHAQWRYRLDVIVDRNRRVYFDRPALKFQYFPGVVVYTPTYILNQSEIVMMFDSGVGVEVLEAKGFMSARVFLPMTYMNKTKGLLGNWSNDITDDFVRPDGYHVPYDTLNQKSDFRYIHEDFAVHWMLDERADMNKGSSLFIRESGKTGSYFANKSFVPEYHKYPADILVAQNRSNTDIESILTSLCGDSYQCQYDYAMTLNREMAVTSRNFYDSFTRIRETNLEKIVSCGILETPRYGQKDKRHFTPGEMVEFTCYRDFYLVGDQRRECLPTGKWSLPEYGYTECLREHEYGQQFVWYTMIIIICTIGPILFLLIAVFSYIFRKSQNESSSGKLSWPFTDRSSSTPSSTNNPSARPISSTYARAISPVSEASQASDGTGSKKRLRKYDAVYLTHEPLPGKPNVDFEDKEWDAEIDEVLNAPASDDINAVPRQRRQASYV